MGNEKDKILALIDRKIERREATFRGFTKNPVNIKQKRSLNRIIISLEVLKGLKQQILGLPERRRWTARQGMVVSIKELKAATAELEEEVAPIQKQLKTSKDEVETITFIVPIINKTPECGDTWELEKCPQKKSKNYSKK